MNTAQNITEKARELGGRFSHVEGSTTKAIESATSAVPSSLWLILAGGSVVGALVLKIMRRDETANFVGQWAPTFLALGIYNKMVKLLGSERRERST